MPIPLEKPFRREKCSRDVLLVRHATGRRHFVVAMPTASSSLSVIVLFSSSSFTLRVHVDFRKGNVNREMWWFFFIWDPFCGLFWNDEVYQILWRNKNWMVYYLSLSLSPIFFCRDCLVDVSHIKLFSVILVKLIQVKKWVNLSYFFLNLIF